MCEKTVIPFVTYCNCKENLDLTSVTVDFLLSLHSASANHHIIDKTFTLTYPSIEKSK